MLARLVHAEASSRIVEVTALQGEERLGSALGEAATAEDAEDRARQRLMARMDRAELAQPVSTSSSGLRVAPVLEKGTTPTRKELAPSTAAAASAPLQPAQASRQADEMLAHEPVTPPFGSGPGPQLPAATGRPPLDRAPRPAVSAATPSPHASAAPQAEPAEPADDPQDWSSELAALDLQLRRLGWDREQEASYLLRAFGHPSRSRLTTYADIKAYLMALEGLAAAADPTSAPVPLRRRDLLAQSDQLLGQLGWKGEQARQFLEKQLGATSRQQLNDSLLLQFNMLLESELINAGPGDGRMADPPPPAP